MTSWLYGAYLCLLVVNTLILAWSAGMPHSRSAAAKATRIARAIRLGFAPSSQQCSQRPGTSPHATLGVTSDTSSAVAGGQALGNFFQPVHHGEQLVEPAGVCDSARVFLCKEDP